MMDATQRVLDRLADVGFVTRRGSLTPFGEELPLATGAAWDMTTAQLAIVAELSDNDSDDAWRQLLFAGSGLRHQLVATGPAGFGTPVVLAVVDDDGERRLRWLTEQLAQRYAVFHRVDLNLVHRRDLADDERLDLALAPLLPTCRRMLGQEISRAEVQRFWTVLRGEIERAARDLDDLYADFREVAGADGATALIGSNRSDNELPAPVPIPSLQLRSFRSFTTADVHLAAVSVIHGPNGGGKSTLIEGLELAWAGRSQRQPSDVGAAEYARHLPNNGEGRFEVRGADALVTEVEGAPRSELPRCVLGQDVVGDLIRAAPTARYDALLTTTGLEIPDLKSRTGELVKHAKHEADRALAAAGLPPLPRADSLPLKHLRSHLAGHFSTRMPAAEHLDALRQAVAEAASGAFVLRVRDDEAVRRVLAEVDARIADVLAPESTTRGGVGDALDDAAHLLRSIAGEQHATAAALRALLARLERGAKAAASVAAAAPAAESDAAPGVPVVLAVRWLTHSTSIAEAGQRFRAEAAGLESVWRRRLDAYADLLAQAADATPRKELEALTQAMPAPVQSAPPTAGDDELWRAAGFSRAASDATRIAAPAEALAEELQRHGEALLTLATDIERHPARNFAENRQPVLRALCRFDLARTLRREGPVMRASEQLVGELLQGRLTPVLRELVAAIVRFEWYFKPLQVPQAGRTVVLGGLSTSHPDLDARLVLNAAERTVVGVAWFLALHLLQPAARRRVLVLDDPTGAFDAVNQAGFVSTLRAFVRLTRPDQLVVTTHDDALGAALAEEFAPVDGWPTAVARLRCQRDADDASVVTVEWRDDAVRHLAAEVELLGLEGEAKVFT